MSKELEEIVEESTVDQPTKEVVDQEKPIEEKPVEEKFKNEVDEDGTIKLDLTNLNKIPNPPETTEEEVVEISKKAGQVEAEQVEEKINPTPEELVRLEEALKNLEEKSKIEEPVVTEETTQYFVDDEEIVVEESEPTLSELPDETQNKIKRLSYTKNV